MAIKAIKPKSTHVPLRESSVDDFNSTSVFASVCETIRYFRWFLVQVQCDVNCFLFFFRFFQTRWLVNNAMSHPVVRHKVWLIAVVAVILKGMGNTKDFKDTLFIKEVKLKETYLFEIIIIQVCLLFQCRQCRTKTYISQLKYNKCEVENNPRI